MVDPKDDLDKRAFDLVETKTYLAIGLLAIGLLVLGVPVLFDLTHGRDLPAWSVVILIIYAVVFLAQIGMLLKRTFRVKAKAPGIDIDASSSTSKK